MQAKIVYWLSLSNRYTMVSNITVKQTRNLQ